MEVLSQLSGGSCFSFLVYCGGCFVGEQTSALKAQERGLGDGLCKEPLMEVG